MVRRSWAFRYQALFQTIVIAASYIAGVIRNVAVGLTILLFFLVFSVFMSFVRYRSEKIQSESTALTNILEEEVLPSLIEQYRDAHPQAPHVRANVMIARRRNLHIFNQSRGDVHFWEKTLKIEGSIGDYDNTSESNLEWKLNEGVVGRAMNDRAQEIWADMDFANADRAKAGWNLTDKQWERTNHLNSFLCAPIYLQTDSEKVKPVGVVNLDSEVTLEKCRFEDEEIREFVINHANMVGAIIE